MPATGKTSGRLTKRWAAAPGADKEANWLPAPASGPFNLTLRDYWPKESMLDGTYKLPPIRKAP